MRQFVLKLLATSLISLAGIFSTSAFAAAEEKACDPNEVAVATRPIPPQRSWAWGKYQEKEKALEAKPQVIVLGDSIAERWPQAEIQRLFPGNKVANFGLGSDRVQTTLWRLDQVQPGTASPEVALIVLGTNNIPEVNDVCGIAEGIKSLNSRLFEKWPSLKQIYLMGPLPRGAYFAQFEEKINETRTAFEGIADENPLVTYLDPPEGIACDIKEPSSIIDEIAESIWGAPDCSFYQKDRLHLSENGYTYLVDYFANTINMEN